MHFSHNVDYQTYWTEYYCMHFLCNHDSQTYCTEYLCELICVLAALPLFLIGTLKTNSFA